MPYKIVQRIERGKITLVIVSSFWEEDGCLWWPPKKVQELIHDEQSKPKKEWRLMKCTLKRNDIRTFQMAESELSLMEQNSDTDFSETNMVAPLPNIIRNQDNIMKYEEMVNNLRCDQETPQAAEHTTNRDNMVQIISTETLNFDQILANQKILFEKIDNMIQLQAITLDNQQKIVQKLATQSVQLEELSAQLADTKGSPSVTLLKDINPADNESFTIKPIESQRDLILLDQSLANRQEKNKLKKSLSFLCSASKSDGKTCAYKLLDILFTRDFFCNCSWAGGSRGNMSKIALKDYKNVLKFFHGMIQIWDPTYTVEDNEQFFKVITKNSKQRKLMKNLRTSSKRCRKNKDSFNKQQNSTESDKTHLDDEKETEGESLQIQEQEMVKESIFLNNMSDDDIEGHLC